MKAFVINEDQIIKAGMVLAGVVVAVFLLGYYVGSKNLFTDNATHQQNKVAAESTKSTDIAAAKIDKKSKPERSAAKPEKTTKTVVKKKAETKQPKKVVKKAVPKKKEVKRKVVKAENKKQLEKTKAKPPVIRKNIEKKEIVKTVKDKKPASIAGNTINPDFTEGTAEERLYSIQAGMFASEANANSFIEKLSKKQFDAYVSDFVSTSGTTKYNVRVGKFEQRDQARLLLKEFQKSFSSPAYVVITQ